MGNVFSAIWDRILAMFGSEDPGKKQMKAQLTELQGKRVEVQQKLDALLRELKGYEKSLMEQATKAETARGAERDMLARAMEKSAAQIKRRELSREELFATLDFYDQKALALEGKINTGDITQGDIDDVKIDIQERQDRASMIMEGTNEVDAGFVVEKPESVLDTRPVLEGATGDGEPAPLKVSKDVAEMLKNLRGEGTGKGREAQTE